VAGRRLVQLMGGHRSGHVATLIMQTRTRSDAKSMRLVPGGARGPPPPPTTPPLPVIAIPFMPITTPEEVRAWCESTHLEIERLNVVESGIGAPSPAESRSARRTV
jgi:hypothetical protein